MNKDLKYLYWSPDGEEEDEDEDYEDFVDEGV